MRQDGGEQTPASIGTAEEAEQPTLHASPASSCLIDPSSVASHSVPGSSDALPQPAVAGCHHVEADDLEGEGLSKANLGQSVAGQGKQAEGSDEAGLSHVLSDIDEHIRALHAGLPLNTLLLVVTCQGDTAEVRRLQVF